MEQFCIFKNEKKTPGSTQPDYRVSVRKGDKYETWGACWLKEGKSGKFFSCSKSKPMDESKKVEKPVEDSSVEIPF